MNDRLLGGFFHTNFAFAPGVKRGAPQGTPPPLSKRSGERSTMKREFLESLDLGESVKLPKSAIDAIMAENGG